VGGRSAQINRPWFIKWSNGKLFSVFIFGMYLAASSSLLLAQSLGQNKITREPYNYNAVCLFVDFAIGSNTPPMNQARTAQERAITRLKEDYAPGVPMYKYQASGVRTIYIQKSDGGIFVLNMMLAGHQIPAVLRSKKYLYAMFEVADNEKTQPESSFQCDNSDLKFIFSGDTLSSLEINFSTAAD
jgi:hypothetical protein